MRNRLREYVISNKDDLTKNPLTVPLVSYYDNNTSLIGAIKGIIYAVCKESLDSLMQPYYIIVDGFMTLFGSITNSINIVRQQIVVIKNMLFNIFENMYHRIETSVATMMFLFLKIREVMKRTYGMTTLMMYTIQHSVIFLESIIASPVGAVANMLGDSGWAISTFALGVGGIPAWKNIDLCFSPDTIVVVDGTDKMMKDINIGDKIYNNTVLGKIVCSYTNQDMYIVSNVIVSGGHAIDIMGNGIRVKDYMNSKKLEKYNYDKLICLITDTGYIQTKDGTIFRDYLDVHDIHMHTNVKNMIKKYLNNIWEYADENKVDLLNGIILDNDTKIINKDDDIIGEVDIDKYTVRMYKLKTMNDNTLYSAGMLIYYDNKWICIYEHPDAEYVDMNNEIVKNWIVRDNIIKLSNGIIVRDLIEIGDNRLNEYISKYLLL